MFRRNFVKRLGACLSSAVLCSLGVVVASGSSPAGASGYQSQHAGGTLHLVATAAGGTLDPQINYTLQYWQLYQATYDGLVAFQKVGGEASFDVVPDLATAMPKVTNDGKTYTFTLRKGIKFSNGKTVTVADVLASFQRLFKVSSPNVGSWYNDIVGGPACVTTPATCTLKGGVVVNAATNTVVFNLIAPDAEFLDQLAVPFGSIIPANTPPKDQGDNPIPGTGAYYFASYNPNSALVMKRNPYFKVWSAAAQPQGYPNEIEMTFGLPVESEVTAVENGQADWMFDPIPADRLSTISSDYASQVHVHSLTADWYAPMNMNIPPFNNLKARQAVNYALNKFSLVKLYGGTELAQPTCTILPPGFPGYLKYCAYNSTSSSTYTGPDIKKAKALVKASGTYGEKVAVVAQNDPVDESVGEYIEGVLNQIGYKASLKPLSQNIEFNYIQNTNNKVQISVTQWYQDYPAASDFLKVLLNCDNFHKGSDNSINIAGMCVPSIDKLEATAETEELTNQKAANVMWGKIDKLIMTTQAPWVPLFNPKLIDFVSKRVGNYQFSLEFYMYVDQLWVK